MSFSNRDKSSFVPNRAGIVLGLAMAVSFTFAVKAAVAAAPNESVLDAAALLRMEQQAEAAQPREQCFLYTQVVHSLTEAAGKQLADGQDQQAASTIQHIQAVTAKMQKILLKDSKRMKNAEELMEHTTRRLADMLHLASSETRPVLEATLQRLNAEQSAMLNEVFAE